MVCSGCPWTWSNPFGGLFLNLYNYIITSHIHITTTANKEFGFFNKVKRCAVFFTQVLKNFNHRV